MSKLVHLAVTFAVIALQSVAFLNCSGRMQSYMYSENSSLSEPKAVGNFRALGDMLVHEDVYKNWQAGIMDGGATPAPGQISVQSAHYNIGMKYWPQGLIPIKYDYNEAAFTVTESNDFKNKISEACRIWGQYANIKCVAYTGTQEFYLAAILSTRDEIIAGCGSFAGACATYPLGTSRRYMHAMTTAEMPTILHEFGHALGLVHEHQRPDLGAYLNYPASRPSNVSAQYYSSVMPVSAARALGEYDPQSIMHYAYNVISDAGITLKPQYAYMASVMRTVAEARVSPLDAEGVQRLYGASTSVPGKACESPSTNKFIFPHDTRYSFFENASPVNSACKAQARICQNGTLTGSSSYRFTSCESICQTRDGGQFKAAAGAQRLYLTVSGSTTEFYSIMAQCEGTRIRTQSDTILRCVSGSCKSVSYFEASDVVTFTTNAADYLSKAPVAAQVNQPCTFQGKTVNDGARVTAYKVASVASGKSCSSESETRTCSNGTLSGSYVYASCTVENPPSVMDYLTPQEQKRAKYVTVVYRKALMRDPDDRGLIFWSRDYEGYNGCRNVTKSFVVSPEASAVQAKLNNRDFVHYAYDIVFSRDSYKDVEGSKFWTSMLDTGAMTRAEVLDDFFFSDELTNICVKTYGIEP
ncbi:MAG: DUF4214 domain-containing protein [Bdellovibrionales bacterium]|nr:DUF4214 domain-containing protein [Bdellovibrionales bacterium]